MNQLVLKPSKRESSIEKLNKQIHEIQQEKYQRNPGTVVKQNSLPFDSKQEKLIKSPQKDTNGNCSANSAFKFHS